VAKQRKQWNISFWNVRIIRYKEKSSAKELSKRVGAWKMRIDKLLGDITLLKHTMEYVRTTKRMDN
jgi:hypothetical protein